MEPPLRGARPILMGGTLRVAVLAVACGLLLAGCGSGSSSKKDDRGAGEVSAKVGACPADSTAIQQARKVASTDVDGDGQADTVRLTAVGGKCPGVLFAKVSGGYLSAKLPTGQPPVTGAFGIDLPGRDGSLLVTRQDHPRGGFQVRVFAVGDNGLAELTYGDKPLLPFVATDVQERPLSVDCKGARIVVTEAVPHAPAGVVPAWDVQQTAYSVDGSDVTDASTKEVATNVRTKQLASRYPALTKYAVFPSCRA